MYPSTRVWLGLSLALLVLAALLHSAFLFGAAQFWPALVHLTLFGWISAMIVTIKLHTIPVFTGRSFPWPRLIWLQCIAFTTGVASTALGLLVGQPMLVTSGIGLELFAALLMTANIIGLLTLSKRQKPVPPLPTELQAQQPAVDLLSRKATALAALCWPLALGGLLGVRLNWWGATWWLAAEHAAALGWVSLMIVGVASHVLPRFSRRNLRSAGLANAQLGLHSLALLLIVVGVGAEQGALFAFGGLVMSGALALFVWNSWPTLVALRSSSALIMPSVKEQRT